MRAATGIQLKQSTKDFQSLAEYLFLPKFDNIHTLLEKSINSSDRSRFVIAPQNENFIWKFNFQSIKEAYRLYPLAATIDIIT